MPAPPKLVEHFVTVNERAGTSRMISATDARAFFRSAVDEHRDKPERSAVALYRWTEGDAGYYSMVERTVVGGSRW